MSDTHNTLQHHVNDSTDEEVNTELARVLESQGRNKYTRFVMAALGSIPWVGGLIASTAAYSAEAGQGKANDLVRRWIEEHEERIALLSRAIVDITSRLSGFDEEIQRRLESDDYIAIVRKAFKIWDDADTAEKRRLVQNLLANSGASRICSDDVVRLFADWIERYSDIHFNVIRVIYQHSHTGIGRGDIWDAIHGEKVREDSAEADLYKLLVRDLSTGGVIRQHRETTFDGRYVKKQSSGRSKGGGTMKSAFDNSDPYELTELGKQFVHYTMNEVVPRIGDTNPNAVA